jgi:hypothetical protein
MMSFIEPVLFSKTGNSIYNDTIRDFLYKNIQSYFSQENYSQMNNTEEYCRTLRHWVLSSQLNKIEGLDGFPVCEVALGVTQTLDAFHYEILIQNRKLRLFRGEYPYNRDVHAFDMQKDFIDDRPLQEGDAIIISCPFSGSGNIHAEMTNIIRDAEKLDVPILVDLAWFGTCAGININLESKAIKYVAFSLTKSLTCGNYRSGVRFSRGSFAGSGKTTDRISLQHEWQHGIHLNTYIGEQLMKNFSPDYHYLKYRPYQEQVCEQYGLQPSQCVHIALGGDLWRDYHRDEVYNRINIRDAIKKLSKQSK